MNILPFLLASITVNTPDKISGLVDFVMPIEITSTKPETLSIQLTLDTMETVKSMSIKDVSVWCDSIPCVKERAVYNISDLKADWQTEYITTMPEEKGKTIECEKGYYWSKEYGLVKGFLKEGILTDSHHFVGNDKYIDFYSDYVSVGKTSTDFDKIVIPKDMLGSDKLKATTIINNYKVSVGAKNDTKQVLSTNVISKGGINNIIIPKGTSKVKIIFKKAKAELGTIEGNHGLVIKNKSGGVLYNKVFNSWYSTYDYRQCIKLNTDSLTANLVNFPYPCWWKVYATHTSGTKTIVKLDNATEYWTNTEGDSVIWILKDTLHSTGDSVYFYINSTGTDKWNKDSGQCVFDTTNGWVAVYHMDETSGNLIDETYNGHTGTANGSIVYSKIGSIGTADSLIFSGSCGYFSCGTMSLPSTNYTMEMNIKPYTYTRFCGVFMSSSAGGGGENGFYLDANVGYSFTFYSRPTILYTGDTVNSTNYPSTSWTYGCFVMSDSARYFRNGNKKYAGATVTNVNNESFSIGRYGAYNDCSYNAGMSFDEMRIAKVSRTYNWVKNTYLFQYSRTWQTWRTEESSSSPPTVTTDSANNIVDMTATIWGKLTNWGGVETNCWFDYDTLKNFTTQDSTTKGVVDSGDVFSANISSLTASTKYYYRALASNSAGIDTGVIDSFTTLSHIPVLTDTRLIVYNAKDKTVGIRISIGDTADEALDVNGNVKADTVKAHLKGYADSSGYALTYKNDSAYADTSGYALTYKNDSAFADTAGYALTYKNDSAYSDTAGYALTYKNDSAYADTAGYAKNSGQLGGVALGNLLQKNKQDTLRNFDYYFLWHPDSVSSGGMNGVQIENATKNVTRNSKGVQGLYVNTTYRNWDSTNGAVNTEIQSINGIATVYGANQPFSQIYQGIEGKAGSATSDTIHHTELVGVSGLADALLGKVGTVHTTGLFSRVFSNSLDGTQTGVRVSIATNGRGTTYGITSGASLNGIKRNADMYGAYFAVNNDTTIAGQKVYGGYFKGASAAGSQILRYGVWAENDSNGAGLYAKTSALNKVNAIYAVGNVQTTDTVVAVGGRFTNLAGALTGNASTSSGITGFTAGSIPYIGGGGLFRQNNANLFWDSTNARLNIGGTNATTGAAGASLLTGGGIMVGGQITSIPSTPGVIFDLNTNRARWLNWQGNWTSTYTIAEAGGGSVGINKNNPASALDVNGTVTATTFSGAGTSLTGTAASLTAGNVTTNANLTGFVTSVGNATSLASGQSPTFTSVATSGGGITTGNYFVVPVTTINCVNGANGTITVTGGYVIINGPTAVYNLTNMTATGGPTGTIVTLYNNVAFTLTVKSAAGGTGQILTPNGADLTIGWRCSAIFVFDGANWETMATCRL